VADEVCGPAVMDKAPRKLLLEGRPGSGKSTVARALVEMLLEREVPVAGFVTEEIRERGRRVGFSLQVVGGGRATLAHVDLTRPVRVGRYAVDTATFERLAIPALERSKPEAVLVIDELGKMELASPAFRELVNEIFSGGHGIFATVHAHRHPFTDALKQRPQVKLRRITARNREGLPRQLVAELTGR
jgi:nucleoside-triphosphatase